MASFSYFDRRIRIRQEKNVEHIILFDLDGTLTDPKEGITKSVQYALKAYGIEEPDRDKLCPFIGPPLTDSFQKFYGFTPEDAKAALYKYREYFSVKGIFENKVYEGMGEMLKKLKQEGFILAVATSKPELFAEQILEHFELSQYFTVIGGADMEEKRVKKADVIAYTLERLSAAKDEADIVMVGDRLHDAEGAKEHGIPCLGVLYGYGSREELLQAGVFALAESVADLESQLLMRKKKSDLIEAAFSVLNRSYAPYSGFQVAAALLCEDGTVYTGVNVENASYPAGCCAERTAIFKAVSEGHKEFRAIAICGGKEGIVTDYCAPCGICRQVMREFCDPEKFEILLPKTQTNYKTYRLCELLPESFGPEVLNGT